jgi:hypothetical protein|tara:strand:- start:1071 stop:1244 length:174 start_codon:yes stop_codon:yes gene_type:complete
VVKVQNKDQLTEKDMKKTTKEFSGKNRNLIKEMKVRTINNIPFHEPIPEEIKKEYNL